jgi:hypothetical protein
MMEHSALFEWSEQESNILGYNIARGNSNTLQYLPELQLQLQLQEIDVLKLSLSNTQPDLFSQLNLLKLPYYLLGMVVEFKAIFKEEVLPYTNKDIAFIEYCGQDEALFTQLVKDVFNGVAASYYTNPEIVVDELLHTTCLAAYLCTQNSFYDRDKFTHLLYYKNQLAGFITSYRKGTGGGVTYAGILPQFARKALFTDMIYFIQNYGVSIGQKWGTFYGQLQNKTALKMYCRAGLTPIGHTINVHVNAFYGKLKDKRLS